MDDSDVRICVLSFCLQESGSHGGAAGDSWRKG